jgi:hypothetical protein
MALAPRVNIGRSSVRYASSVSLVCLPPVAGTCTLIGLRSGVVAECDRRPVC